MKPDVEKALSAVGAGWWENRSLGLVYAQSPSLLEFACHFPELLSGRHLRVAHLRVADEQGAWIGRCQVIHPFAPLFDGLPGNFHFASGECFDEVAGHYWEEKATLTPDAWIARNLAGLETLHGRIVERQQALREGALPEADLQSGVIARLVREYRFKPGAYPSPALAAEEFCRRFAYKPLFLQLLHPQVSVRRAFEALAP